jgi:hypothetical protein
MRRRSHHGQVDAMWIANRRFVYKGKVYEYGEVVPFSSRRESYPYEITHVIHWQGPDAPKDTVAVKKRTPRRKVVPETPETPETPEAPETPDESQTTFLTPNEEPTLADETS